MLAATRATFGLLSLATVVTQASPQLDPPVGTFCASVPFIIKENITVRPDHTFDYFNDVGVAHVHVACRNETYKWDGSGSMDISALLANPNDCITKATSGEPKSVPTLSWDGTNVISKNGYGTLKMAQNKCK